MAEITDKLNETTGEWMASHKSKNDYDLYHSPKWVPGNKHFKNWAHYQASTNIYQDSKYLNVKIFLKPVWVGKICTWSRGLCHTFCKDMVVQEQIFFISTQKDVRGYQKSFPW